MVIQLRVNTFTYNQLARNIAGADDKFKEVKGFDIPDGAIKGPVADVAGNKGYAFYSDVGTATNAELYNFYAAGSAPNYFAGGIETNVVKGHEGNLLNFRVGPNAPNGRFIFRTDSVDQTPTSGLIDSNVTITGTQSNNGADTYPCGIRSEIATDENFDDVGSAFICAYQSRVVGNSAKPNGKYVHYFAPQKRTSSSAVDEVIGFRSAVSTADATNAYGFYAAGTAENYFAGSLKIASDPGIQVNSGTGVMLTPNGATFGKTDDTTNSSCTTFTRRVATGTAENTQARILTFRGQSSNIATIRFDGSGGVTNVISTSDYRVKENVVDMPSAIESIKALRPVEFNYINSPGKTTKGFIAHELQAVEPLAAFGTKDATEAIGTLTDWDGTKLETEVTEPSAEELTYTEEVETDGVATDGDPHP